ncbi:hypothetical protein FNF27_08193 [Cafeteria roenbergensis]|uniref:Uncharacterized protein n=1 Tax=Cafeteria roenbergensis TaxID=33653 RepID=A0A5A8D6A6_CAFRO|nr:hypothetical protein FNF27_08193 [Cafeteria roenbergensis]
MAASKSPVGAGSAVVYHHGAAVATAKPLVPDSLVKMLKAVVFDFDLTIGVLMKSMGIADDPRRILFFDDDRANCSKGRCDRRATESAQHGLAPSSTEDPCE